jgi:hypothetical protein
MTKFTLETSTRNYKNARTRMLGHNIITITILTSTINFIFTSAEPMEWEEGQETHVNLSSLQLHVYLA